MALSGIDQAAIFDLGESPDRQMQAAAAGVGLQVLGELERMGPLGQYIVERGQRALEAIREIATVDPTDQGKIIELQGRIRDYQHVVDWVEARMGEGRAAEVALSEPVDADDFEGDE